MNIRPSAKYGFSPEEVEKRALESEKFKVFYICIDQKKQIN